MLFSCQGRRDKMVSLPQIHIVRKINTRQILDVTDFPIGYVFLKQFQLKCCSLERVMAPTVLVYPRRKIKELYAWFGSLCAPRFMFVLPFFLLSIPRPPESLLSVCEGGGGVRIQTEKQRIQSSELIKRCWLLDPR